jgi:hypothetical protein
LVKNFLEKFYKNSSLNLVKREEREERNVYFECLKKIKRCFVQGACQGGTYIRSLLMI